MLVKLYYIKDESNKTNFIFKPLLDVTISNPDIINFHLLSEQWKTMPLAVVWDIETTLNWIE